MRSIIRIFQKFGIGVFNRSGFVKLYCIHICKKYSRVKLCVVRDYIDPYRKEIKNRWSDVCVCFLYNNSLTHAPVMIKRANILCKYTGTVGGTDYSEQIHIYEQQRACVNNENNTSLTKKTLRICHNPNNNKAKQTYNLFVNNLWRHHVKYLLSRGIFGLFSHWRRHDSLMFCLYN